MNTLRDSPFERRCQKPNHRQQGNWMARRVTRPMALRVTWVIHRTGISAHAMTLIAWAIGLAAAACLGRGTPLAWLCGTGLLQLWYLLDHVDGQLARYRGTASLDGTQLDFLMHHAINVAVPYGVGYGLSRATNQTIWIHLGLLWGIALLLTGLIYDARYKAFHARLKDVRGRLWVVGGRQDPVAPRLATRSMMGHLVAYGRFGGQKLCEIHVVMNLLSVLAVVQWTFGDTTMMAGRLGMGVLLSAALIVASVRIGKSLRRGRSEQEFARWYRIPADRALLHRDGHWLNIDPDSADAADTGDAVSGEAKSGDTAPVADDPFAASDDAIGNPCETIQDSGETSGDPDDAVPPRAEAVRDTWALARDRSGEPSPAGEGSLPPSHDAMTAVHRR
jgi:phosphatidylglycerophosphate synthase